MKKVCLLALVISMTTGTIAVQFYESDSPNEPITPIPFVDIVKDLRVLYLGNTSDYFVSTYATDARSARLVCQNLTSLTGKGFNLLTLETESEVQELLPYVEGLDYDGVWLAGEKTFDSKGDISVLWINENGNLPMDYKNFRQGASVRRLESLGGRGGDYEVQDREYVHESSGDYEYGTNFDSSGVMYPWIQVHKMDQGTGKCKAGKLVPPDCEPVKCNVTLPECTTETPACEIRNQTECTVQRPDCSAKCGNCTVVPPVCYAKPKPCTVITGECQTMRAPCTIETPPCVTTRPECKTTQPICQVTTPPPCTTQQPCIPSFRKDNCTTVGTKTICEPSYRCPPPVVCQSPAIICPPPIVYCPDEITVCPEPILRCSKPVIYCPEPVVDCPDPEIICSQPQVICESPVITCPGYVTSCKSPQFSCEPPTVNCPPPLVDCSPSTPCPEPERPFPPCEPEPEPSTTTTEKPCPGCGCISMNKKDDFKWDISQCKKELHFICEG